MAEGRNSGVLILRPCANQQFLSGFFVESNANTDEMPLELFLDFKNIWL